MVTKEHTEHQKALHRAVYNDWGLYSFVQMLSYNPHSAVWVWTNFDYFEERWVKHSKPRIIQGSSYKAEW